MKKKTNKQNNTGVKKNTSMKNNQGLQISLILLIIFLLICNVSKFIHNLNRSKDNFYDTNSNQINYMKNPKCENNSYCPNRHPNIPCHLVKKCNSSRNYENDRHYRIQNISIFSKFIDNLSKYFKSYDKVSTTTSSN